MPPPCSRFDADIKSNIIFSISIELTKWSKKIRFQIFLIFLLWDHQISQVKCYIFVPIILWVFKFLILSKSLVVWNSVTQRELLRLQHSVTLCLCWGTFTSIFNFLGWKSMWNCCCLLFSHDEYVASVKCWRIHFSSTTIDHLSKSENAFSIFFSPSSSAYLSAAAACLLSVFVYLSMIFQLLESIMFLVD